MGFDVPIVSVGPLAIDGVCLVEKVGFLVEDLGGAGDVAGHSQPPNSATSAQKARQAAPV